jgi:hypothetical protein
MGDVLGPKRLVALAGSLIAAVLVGKSRLDSARTELLAEFLGDTDARSARTFEREDLEGLPAPVQRYLDTVLEEGQPYVRVARLRQRGTLRTGGRTSPWREFGATHYVTVDPPGFLWDARIEIAPLLSVRVLDAFRRGAGFARVRLLSVVPVGGADPSPELNAAELMRYLAETVWYPTAFLPSEGVEWGPIDDRSARATLEHRGTRVSLVFHFDDSDRVERVHAEARYREVNGSFEPTPWTGYFSDYRVINGMTVPIEGEVEWHLPDGDLSAWRGRIEGIDYRPTG